VNMIRCHVVDLSNRLSNSPAVQRTVHERRIGVMRTFDMSLPNGVSSVSFRVCLRLHEIGSEAVKATDSRL